LTKQILRVPSAQLHRQLRTIASALLPVKPDQSPLLRISGVRVRCAPLFMPRRARRSKKFVLQDRTGSTSSQKIAAKHVDRVEIKSR